jgi:hypothetical protein
VKIKLGARYRSQVCDTEVIAVQAPPGEVDLTRGGQPMEVPAAAGQLTADPALLGGNQIGKRYTDGGKLELLVVRPGEGTLAMGGTLLAVKESKPLPSSD